MKKAKIMLLSLSLFAILGAALAFKAKTFSVEWCSTTEVVNPDVPTLEGQNVCPAFLENRVEGSGTGATTIYATSEIAPGQEVISQDDCSLVITCPIVTLIPD